MTMSIWKQHRALAAILAVVILLLCTQAGPVLATETVPEETVPEVTEPKVYTVDPESEVYKVCEELSGTLDATQILVYDNTADTILYSKTQEGGKLYPASITKLFSCYVALQYLDPLDAVTVGDEMDLVHAGSSLAYIAKGNRLYVQTLVEGMMLPSGNDAAMILATAAGRKIAGKEEISAAEAAETFVKEMNRMAKELGFERTHFSNPDGWHTGSHYTCLNDMARIAKLALENRVIARYMRMGDDEVTFLSGQKKEWKNTNLFVSKEEGFFRYDAIGMKTGYTRPAEYCLMSAFRLNDGRNLVIGVFGYADTYKRFNDVSKLANACRDQFDAEAKEAKESNKQGTP